MFLSQSHSSHSLIPSCKHGVRCIFSLTSVLVCVDPVVVSPGIVREMAHRSDSKLKSISTTRLNPQHHLWYEHGRHLHLCAVVRCKWVEVQTLSGTSLVDYKLLFF